jgi:hypothetical protein
MGGGYEKAIRKALDECLLTDAEWAQWEKVMNSKKLKTMEKKVRSQPAVDCPPPPLRYADSRSCAQQKALEALFDDGFEEWVVSEARLGSTRRGADDAMRCGRTTTTTRATTTTEPVLRFAPPLSIYQNVPRTSCSSSIYHYPCRRGSMRGRCI